MDQNSIDDSVFVKNIVAMAEAQKIPKEKLGIMLSENMSNQKFDWVTRVACMDVNHTLIPASQKKRLGEYISSLGEADLPSKVDPQLISDTLKTISSNDTLKSIGISKLIDVGYTFLLYKAIKQNKVSIAKKYLNRGLKNVPNFLNYAAHSDILQTFIKFIVENDLFEKYQDAISTFIRLMHQMNDIPQLNLDNQFDFYGFACLMGMNPELKNISGYIAAITEKPEYYKLYFRDLSSLIAHHGDQRLIDTFILMGNDLTDDESKSEYINSAFRTKNKDIVKNALKYGSFLNKHNLAGYFSILRDLAANLNEFEDMIKMLPPWPNDRSLWLLNWADEDTMKVVLKYSTKN